MQKTVHWLLEVSINKGQLDTFKVLIQEMVAATQDEPDTLIYEWCFNGDESACQINERYRDSAAAMRHLQSFEGFATRFLAAVTPVKLVVLGNPDAGIREGLAGLNPIYFDIQSGFSR